MLFFLKAKISMKKIFNIINRLLAFEGLLLSDAFSNSLLSILFHSKERANKVPTYSLLCTYYKQWDFSNCPLNKKCENIKFSQVFSAPCRARTGDLLIKRQSDIPVSPLVFKVFLPLGIFLGTYLGGLFYVPKKRRELTILANNLFCKR
jgi:hypothetical protein